MSATKKIAVLGGGSFGTVLANLAASNGYNVSLWVRDSDQALRINSEGANTTYHPELQLSSNIEASEKLESVIKNANIVLIATPSLIFENIVKRITPIIEDGAHIISCTKGIKLDPFRSMSDIIKININSSKNSGTLDGQGRTILEDGTLITTPLKGTWKRMGAEVKFYFTDAINNGAMNFVIWDVDVLSKKVGLRYWEVKSAD